jgi:hypothetical protein
MSHTVFISRGTLKIAKIISGFKEVQIAHNTSEINTLCPH